MSKEQRFVKCVLVCSLIGSVFWVSLFKVLL